MRFERAGAQPKRPALKRTAAGAVLGTLMMVAPMVGSAQTMSFGQAKDFSLGLAATASYWRTDCPQATYCDRHDAGWRLTGAWQFAPQGALELVATEQGRVRADGMGAVGLQSSELRMRGLGVGVAWLLPLTNDWQFAARAGALSNRARFTESAGTGLASEETTHTRTDPMVGVGLSWRLSPSLTVDGRLDWSSTKLAPPASSLIGGGSTSSHHWGLGLTGYF